MALNMRGAATLMILAVAVAVLAVPRRTEAAVTCGTVVSALNPCLPYVTGKGPIGGCCGGVKQLYGQAKTTPDRQAACKCLKTLAGSYKNIDFSKAAGLPKQCGVNLQYSISPSTDCSKVK